MARLRLFPSRRSFLLAATMWRTSISSTSETSALKTTNTCISQKEQLPIVWKQHIVAHYRIFSTPPSHDGSKGMHKKATTVFLLFSEIPRPPSIGFFRGGTREEKKSPCIITIINWPRHYIHVCCTSAPIHNWKSHVWLRGLRGNSGFFGTFFGRWSYFSDWFCKKVFETSQSSTG